MKYRLLILFSLFGLLAKSQSWTPVNSKQRFTVGLGLPVKDSSYYSTAADSAILYINPSDTNNIYWKYKGYHKKIGGTSGDTRYAFIGGSNATGTWPISITGSAPTLTTPRYIYGNLFNGSADITGTIADTYINSASNWNGKYGPNDTTSTLLTQYKAGQTYGALAGNNTWTGNNTYNNLLYGLNGFDFTGQSIIRKHALNSLNNIIQFYNIENGGYSAIISADSINSIPSWKWGSQGLEIVPVLSGNGIISSYKYPLLLQTGNRLTKLQIDTLGNIYDSVSIYTHKIEPSFQNKLKPLIPKTGNLYAFGDSQTAGVNLSGASYDSSGYILTKYRWITLFSNSDERQLQVNNYAVGGQRLSWDSLHVYSCFNQLGNLNNNWQGITVAMNGWNNISPNEPISYFQTVIKNSHEAIIAKLLLDGWGGISSTGINYLGTTGGDSWSTNGITFYYQNFSNNRSVVPFYYGDTSINAKRYVTTLSNIGDSIQFTLSNKKAIALFYETSKFGNSFDVYVNNIIVAHRTNYYNPLGQNDTGYYPQVVFLNNVPQSAQVKLKMSGAGTFNFMAYGYVNQSSYNQGRTIIYGSTSGNTAYYRTDSLLFAAAKAAESAVSDFSSDYPVYYANAYNSWWQSTDSDPGDIAHFTPIGHVHVVNGFNNFYKPYSTKTSSINIYSNSSFLDLSNSFQNNPIQLNEGNGINNNTIGIYSNNYYFRSGTSLSFNPSIFIPSNGNVNIGIESDLGYKLGVNSDVYINGQVIVSPNLTSGVQWGIGGTRIRNASGELQVTNSNATAFADFKANNLTASSLILTSPTSGSSTDSVVTIDGSGVTHKRNASAFGGGGVTSFNTRTGAVTLNNSDVTGALGYTPLSTGGGTLTGSLTGTSATFSGQITNGGGTGQVFPVINGGGSGTGGYGIAFQSGGTYKAIIGREAMVVGSGTSNNLRIQSYSDDIILSAATKVYVSAATASTSTSTGAFVVNGGVGIGGALSGTSASFSSSVTASSLTLTSPTSGSSTDSVVTIDGSGVTHKRNANTFNLATVTGYGNSTNTGVILNQNGNTSTSYAIYGKRIANYNPAGYLIQFKDSTSSYNVFSVDAQSNIINSGSFTAKSSDGVINGVVISTPTNPGHVHEIIIDQPNHRIRFDDGGGGAGIQRDGSGNLSLFSSTSIIYFKDESTNSISATVGNNTITWSGAMTLGGTLTLKGYTVATLPTPSTGMLAYVTDATATTYGTTVTGGGTNTVKVFYNGTNWVIN